MVHKVKVAWALGYPRKVDGASGLPTPWWAQIASALRQIPWLWLFASTLLKRRCLRPAAGVHGAGWRWLSRFH